MMPSASRPTIRSIKSLIFPMMIAAMLGACASSPPEPQWRTEAKSWLDQGIESYLDGATGSAEAAFERSRREIASSGRVDLIAQAELMRCAAAVASAVFEPCVGFDKLRQDAAADQDAYADYLAGRIRADAAHLLPPAHRPFAAGPLEGDAALGALRSIEAPLSRLVALGVLFRSGRANAAAIASGVDTASEQGWRRPLLAWLQIQAAVLEKAGQHEEAQRVKRRIGVVSVGQ